MMLPVSVSVYSRLTHLQRCVASLSQCVGAEQTDLYIFIDGPLPGDENKISEIRNFAESVQGFKTLVVRQRQSNCQIQNMAEAVNVPLRDHPWVIRVEDDLEFAPGFLMFMNEAYQMYKGDPAVLNITGYSPPIDWEGCIRGDAYFLPRTCAWGLCQDQRSVSITSAPISAADLISIISSKAVSATGDDLELMALTDFSGGINAGDVRLMVQQAKTGLLTVYPKNSLVRNLGFDGTGIHCGVSSAFDIEHLWKKKDGFDLPTRACSDESTLKTYRVWRNNNLKGDKRRSFMREIYRIRGRAYLFWKSMLRRKRDS